MASIFDKINPTNPIPFDVVSGEGSYGKELVQNSDKKPQPVKPTAKAESSTSGTKYENLSAGEIFEKAYGIKPDGLKSEDVINAAYEFTSFNKNMKDVLKTEPENAEQQRNISKLLQDFYNEELPSLRYRKFKEEIEANPLINENAKYQMLHDIKRSINEEKFG